MSKIKILIIFLCISATVYAEESVDFTISASKAKKISMLICSVGDLSAELNQIAQTITNDLSFTGQFETILRNISMPSTIDDIRRYKQEGYALVLLINTKGKHFEWRIYNTTSAKMVNGHKISKQGTHPYWWGHVASDAIVLAMTGSEGPFASKISYCKESAGKRTICIADIDGGHEHELVHVRSKVIAPRWNADPLNPLLLYSEYTKKNIRLMSVNMRGDRAVAINFDGLNMLPSFSSDGKEAVVCLSVDGSSQLYRYGYNKQERKHGYTRMTHNKGNNISPILLSSGDVIFCSDFELGKPQIYYMYENNNLGKDREIKRLTSDSSSTSPAYNAKRNIISYSKMVKGTMQIMALNLSTQEEKQLTFDEGHKDESSWSPDGNYLLFSIKRNNKQAIAIQNLRTYERRLISDTKGSYSFPSWSGRYDAFPSIG